MGLWAARDLHVVVRMLHIAARMRFGTVPYSYLWRALRRAFPEALACCLMPNHLHLLVDGQPSDVVATVRVILNNDGGGPGRWAPIGHPPRFTGRLKMQRQFRYVLLNPCRAGLCAHPLQWTWSTHRDMVGAVVDPWTPAERVCQALGAKGMAWIEQYVTGAPGVSVQGTNLPTPVESNMVATRPLAEVLQAARIATRDSNRAVFRHCAVLLAYDQGWRDTALLGHALSITQRQVQTLAMRPNPARLRAAQLILGDQHLFSVRPRLR